VSIADLPWVCSIAFIAVFALLAFLAAAMYLITMAFPVRDVGRDAALAAAVATSVATLWPGARVTRIEEDRR